MKEIIRKKYGMSFDDGDTWYEVNAHLLSYCEPGNETPVEYTFEELLQNKMFMGALYTIGTTMNKKQFYFKMLYDDKKYKEDDVDTILVRILYNKLNGIHTFKELMEQLPANDFIEYLRDQGIVPKNNKYEYIGDDLK